MARLTRGEQRFLKHFLKHGTRELHGPFEPLTQGTAHQLAPTVIPAPAPPPLPAGTRVDRYGGVSGGALGLSRPQQYELNPVGAAEGLLATAGKAGSVGAPTAVTDAIRQAGLLPLVEKERQKIVASGEAIHPDRLAEGLANLAITTLLTGGLGDPEAIGATAAKTAADTAAAAGEEGARRSAAQILQDAAQSVRAAPQAAREGVEGLATKAGQRAAAEKAGNAGADFLLRHPKYSQVGALGAAGAATGQHSGGLQIPTALVEGTVQAVNPWDHAAGTAWGSNLANTALATARGIEGAVVAPAALLYAAGDSAIHGTPAPFLNTAGAQIQGLGQIAGNLLSGDPATVRASTEHEAGLSFLPLLPKLGDTALAHAGADALRTRANDVRGGINRRLGTGLRYGPDQGLTRARTNQKLRRDVSEDATRHATPEEYIAHQEALELTKQARRSDNSARISKLRDKANVTDEDLLATLAETGIRDPRQIPLVRSKFPIHDELAGARDVNLHRVLDYLEKHPERLTDPDILASIEKYREIQARTPQHEGGNDARATELTQAHIFGNADPLERIPKAVEDLLPPKQKGERPWTRSAAHAYLDSREGHLVELKAGVHRAMIEARTSAATLKEMERAERLRQRRAGAKTIDTKSPRRDDLPTGHDRAVRPAAKTRGPNKGDRRLPESARLQREKERLVHAQAELRGKRAEAKQVGRQIEAIKYGPDRTGGLDELQRPWNAVSSRARRKLWTPEMIDAMREENASSRRALGFADPIYVHHEESLNQAERSTGARGQQSGANEVPKVRRGPAAVHEDGSPASLAGADTVDRTFAALIKGSIEGPRRQNGLKAFTRHIFEKYPIKLRVRRGGKEIETVRMTAKEWDKAVEDGQISERGHIWVPESDYKQVMLDAPAGSSQLADLVQHSDKTNDPGSYGVVIPKTVDTEYKFQVSPQRGVGDKFASTVGNGLQRYLLLSPAWVETQAVAELLPMLMADPLVLLKAPHIWKQIRDAAHEDINAHRAWASVVGEGAIRTKTAAQLSAGYQPRSHGMFSDAARAMERTLPGRVMLSVAKLTPFGIFDQWRQGKYAQLWAAARLDKELNGFLGGLQRMVTQQRSISDELRGIPLSEAMNRIATDPRYKSLLDDQFKYMNQVRGNWRSFTSWERKFAPLSVFYGFLRYAMRWPLQFARHHPLAASVNYFLGQANANELEKMLHGKPASFYQYANPVVHGADGQRSELPAGTRVGATGSPLLEGIGEENLGKAAAGLQNPSLAIPEALLLGTDSFGGHDENEGLLGLHWSLAAKEMMGSTPLARLLGFGSSHSETAEELRANDPNKAERSFIAPWLELGEEGARSNNEIVTDLNEYEEAKKANHGFPPSSSSSSNRWDTGASSSSGNRWDSAGGSSSTNRWDG